MVSRKFGYGLGAAAGVAMALSVSGGVPAAGAAEVVLRAVTAFPTPLASNKPLFTFIDRVAKEGKGKVRVQFLGGPETVSAPDQPQAVRKGVIDILYGAANYYQGVVPEGDAVIGSNKKPWEVRENGGWKLLQDIHAQKMNTHLLGWPGAGFNFYIYLREQPKLGGGGMLDLGGLKMRTTPIYREFLAKLGATPIVIQIPEVYTALERGLVNGVAFPINTLVALGWHKHLKFRIEPGFFTGDVLVNVNLQKWRSMPKATRDLLDRLAARHDRDSWDYFVELEKKEDEAQRKAGMKIWTLSAAAGKKYVSMATQVVWDRLAKKAPENAAKLKAKFYD